MSPFLFNMTQASNACVMCQTKRADLCLAMIGDFQTYNPQFKGEYTHFVNSHIACVHGDS